MALSYDHVISATTSNNLTSLNNVFGHKMTDEICGPIDKNTTMGFWEVKWAFPRTHFSQIYIALMTNYYAKTFR